MAKAKQDIKINPGIFDHLIKLQDDLPDHATGITKKDAAQGYDHPAGLALLGEKDGIIDSIVELSMSGGCWDAPNVNFNDMDKGLRKMIDLERQVIGMALVRHPDWNSQQSLEDAKIPDHLRSQVHTMRHSFADITKTIWIVLHNNYFRIYRPSIGAEKRVLVKEIAFRKLFEKEAFKDGILSERLKRDKEIIQRKIEARRQKIEAKKAEARRLKEVKDAEERAAAAAEEKRRRKLMTIDQKIKEGKDDIIDAGSGFVFMKSKDGKYILWQTPR